MRGLRHLRARLKMGRPLSGYRETNRACLLELHHDVLGQLHVLEHALQLAGERRAALWDTSGGVSSPGDEATHARAHPGAHTLTVL